MLIPSELIALISYIGGGLVFETPKVRTLISFRISDGRKDPHFRVNDYRVEAENIILKFGSMKQSS